LLVIGLLGYELAFAATIGLSALQTAVTVLRERSPTTFPVQIRVAYTLLLVVCFLPYMRCLACLAPWHSS
jgi:hypothetical protein